MATKLFISWPLLLFAVNATWCGLYFNQKLSELSGHDLEKTSVRYFSHPGILSINLCRIRMAVDQERHHGRGVFAQVELHHVLIEFLDTVRRHANRVNAVRHEDSVHHESRCTLIPVKEKLEDVKNGLITLRYFAPQEWRGETGRRLWRTG